MDSAVRGLALTGLLNVKRDSGLSNREVLDMPDNAVVSTFRDFVLRKPPCSLSLGVRVPVTKETGRWTIQELRMLESKGVDGADRVTETALRLEKSARSARDRSVGSGD